VSRATLFRVLRSVDDPVLGVLHADNRRSSKRRVPRTPGTPASWGFSTGSWQTSYSGELALRVGRHGEVLPFDGDVTHVVMRWSVMILHLYRTVFRWNTLGWIHRYLDSIGSAGVVAYASRRDLDRDFPPDSPMPLGEMTFDATLSDGALRGRLQRHQLLVRRAVVSGLRVLDAPVPTTRLSLDWTSARASLRLADVDNADIYDPSR
jgi:hypothetical protein